MASQSTTRKTKRQGRRNGRPRGVAIPDALSKQDKVRAIADSLLNLQRQELDLGLNQTANAHTDDDGIPDAPSVTYGERKALLKSGQVRIAEQHRDLMPLVQAYIAGAHAQQAAQQG